MGVSKDMDQVFDCIYTRPFADDDALLNDFIDRILQNISWRMFERQEEVCYMISEKNPPMLKDNVIEFLKRAINIEMGYLQEYIISNMLIKYRMSNVDLGDRGEQYLRDTFAFEDEDWNEFNKAMNKYVWDSYCKYLGAEETKKYFEKINRPEFIMEED